MKAMKHGRIMTAAVIGALAFTTAVAQAADPLPSWNDGAPKKAIPPEQVVGSSIKTKFELRDGKPVLIRLPEINFIDRQGW